MGSKLTFKRWQKLTVAFAGMGTLLGGLYIAGLYATAGGAYPTFAVSVTGVVSAFMAGNVFSKKHEAQANAPVAG